MRLMNAQINPLAFLDIDGPPAPNVPDQPTPQTILEFVCPPGIPSDVASLVKRYKEIGSEPVRLVAAPAEQRILDKLVWPLRHAKASYMVGNYLAVIALAGMDIATIQPDREGWIGIGERFPVTELREKVRRFHEPG